MQQKVDPARVLELSQLMKIFEREVENHENGMYRDISRLVSDTRDDYQGERMVLRAADQVEDLLREIHAQASSVTNRMYKLGKSLENVARQYQQTEEKAKTMTKQSLSSQFKMALSTLDKLKSQATQNQKRAVQDVLDFLKNPPSLIDLIKGLANQVKEHSLESKLQPFKQDERVASLLDIMRDGNEQEQSWARGELEKIADNLEALAKNQTAYQVYKTYENEPYMEVVQSQAKYRRSILASLGVDPKWYGPGVDVRKYFPIESPLSACVYNPLTTDGSRLPKDSQMRFVVALGLVNEKYRNWAKAHYPEIEVAVKKADQEHKERVRLIEIYNREIPSEDIKKLQEYLKKQNMYLGEVNGEYNEDFLEAVKELQAELNSKVIDGRVTDELVQYVEDAKAAGWLTPVGIGEGIVTQLGEDVVDTLSGIVELPSAAYHLVGQIRSGELTLEDIKQSLGASLAEEYAKPFQTAERLSNKVMNGTATYKECVEYGKALTKIAQVFLVAVSAAKSGVKLTSKVAKKLEGILPETKALTTNGMHMEIPDVDAPELPKGLTDVQKNYREFYAERDGAKDPDFVEPKREIEGTGQTKVQLGKEDLDALRKKWNVPETDTIAVGKTDVRGLEDLTFEGGSPKVRKEAGLPDLDVLNPDRPIKSTGKIPSATRHAEEGVANQFVEAVEKAGIKPEDVVGTLRLHQSNSAGVCPTCLSGLGNPKKDAGVIKQLSLKYPNLILEVTSETVENARINGRLSFKVKNGVYID